MLQFLEFMNHGLKVIPVLAANPIYTTWTLLSDEQQITLIDKDHVYLGVTVDRSLLPTSSISAAEDWLDAISNDMQKQTYDNGNVKIFYVDIISGTIFGLNLFLVSYKSLIIY